jgi:hypothetical protein
MSAQDYFLHEAPSSPHGHLKRRPSLPPIRTEIGLVTCSACLRVQRDRTWIEAEEIIKELRTYELVDPPRLRPGMCDYCNAALAAARAKRSQTIAA